MIDIELIRRDPDGVAANLKRRGVPRSDVDKLCTLDEKWRALVSEVEKLRSRKLSGDEAGQREGGAKVKLELKAVRSTLNEIAEARLKAWQALPNLVAPDVPEGGLEAATVLRAVPAHVGSPPFSPKSYLALAEGRYLDLKRAAKVSGSRFAYLFGPLARLQIALVAWAFDYLTQAARFEPVIVPALINRSSMAGMGYLDHHGEEIYQTDDNLYLIGTGEQALGPLHQDEILAAEDLPRRYVGYSSCFRREAGSHGQDVRGLLRMHQFDKVEMFSFTTPEESDRELQRLVGWQEALMQALELPYRVVKLASRDLGAPAAQTIDIETWLPGQRRYRETHSASNTTDYQARRLNIRVRTKAGTVKAHLLNATAFAIGRTLIALIENHQEADGAIAVPASLHPYLPFKRIRPPSTSAP